MVSPETIAVTQAPPYTNISINVIALLHVFNKYHKFINQYFMLPKKIRIYLLNSNFTYMLRNYHIQIFK